MDIYLVRHPKPEIEKGFCYGQSDLALSEGWQKQATMLKPHFNKMTIYSSPLQRCLTVAQYFSTSIKTSPSLMELNFGNWENTAWNAIPEQELSIWMKDYIHIAPPEGENYLQLVARVSDFWKTLLQTEGDKVLVCHAGVIRSILHLILSIPLTQTFNLELDYFGLTKISVRKQHQQVLYINRTTIE